MIKALLEFALLSIYSGRQVLMKFFSARRLLDLKATIAKLWN